MKELTESCFAHEHYLKVTVQQGTDKCVGTQYKDWRHNIFYLIEIAVILYITLQILKICSFLFLK